MTAGEEPPLTTRTRGRAAARVASWLLIAAVGAGGYCALRSLPGAGGRVDELRWQLASQRFAGTAVNDAARLLWDAESRERGSAGRILAALVADTDPLVASHALGLLTSEFSRQTAGGAKPDPGLRPAFEAWLRSAPLHLKVTQAELTLICSLYLARSTTPPDLGDLPLSDDDCAWLLAGLFSRSLPASAWAHALVFADPNPSDGIADRVERVAKRTAATSAPAAGEWHAISRDRLAGELRIPIETVERLVESPIPSARFAAGAILALAGDARGLPAARDWLASQKVAGAAIADEILTALFGAAWRAP